ncbi:cytochrome P450 [Dactylosporangium sp. CA-139114]|uniref:cytochrome P450 n=1 Tax=Dactylosporangium sp. CA-139114 TaxID=3239931 RepID=UPI003D961975
MIADTLVPEDLTDPELHATGDPHAIWRWMREHAPVYHHRATDLPAFWSLTRYTDIKAAYRDPATFSSARGVLLRPTRLGDDPGGNTTMALTDPPRHKQLRGLMAGWFTERAVRGLEEQIRGAVELTITKAREQGEVDVVNDLVGRLSLYVIGRIMGVADEDLEDMFRWTNEAFRAGQPLATHHRVMQYFIAMMDQRIAEPTDDLVSALVNGTVDGDLLTEEEILLNCENMVGATENARLSMAVGIHAFMRHPQQWRLLREHRELMPTAVEEVLRYASSANHSMRYVTRDVEIRGRQVRAGDWVVLWVPSANRDEECFVDGDRFDITRTPNRHLALGSGEHFCIGSVLARAETRLLLGGLLDSVDRLEQTGPAVPSHSLAVSGPEHLPVRLV